MTQNSFAEFCNDESCFVTKDLQERLVQKALNHPLKKYRYCLHQNPESTLHEMVIVTTKYDMKYPDKHMYTTESNIILRGALLVIFFDEDGEIQKAFIMKPDGMFYYRCGTNQYHMTIPLTDVAVYIEIKEGPFDEKSNVYPEWAPERDNKDKLKVFNQEIKKRAMELIKKGETDASLDEPGNDNAF